MEKQYLIKESGQFFVGCNYWASHAGTNMWSDWQPHIVEQDLKKLSEEGLSTLRVFPLWPDFQPIELLYGGGGAEVEYRIGETLLESTEAGRAGISVIAFQHFSDFLDIAAKYKLRLIVGLITGWMSGRLYVPSALKGRDILTDHTAIMWQVRFLKYFVKTFKNHSAILAWDLGNECNCMTNILNQEDAYVWTAAMSDAIRSQDTTRQIVSGMHSLTPTGPWRMQDQGELTDILTTHPYPFWTPYTDYDPVNTIRPLLHATAETLFYSNIGNAPCFAEETGTMGPMICSDEISADFARTSMLSLWAHNCHGFLWWCAFDQNHLTHAPYDWLSCERELGLIKENGEIKPILKTIGKTIKKIQSMPFEQLPTREIQAVCITNTVQDHWAVAYGAFILAKQAGLDIEFQHVSQTLKEAPLYILPSIKGVWGIPKHFWQQLLENVSKGATLYLSVEDGYIADFEAVTGLQVQTRALRHPEGHQVEALIEESTYVFNTAVKWDLKATSAEILAMEKDGNPIFAVNQYGKGKIYFLTMPIELNVVNTPGTLTDTHASPYWKIYETISEEVSVNRILRKNDPFLGITEHVQNDTERIAILINYSPEPLTTTIEMKSGWCVEKCYDEQMETNYECIGNLLTVKIPANDGMILQLLKNN